MFQRYSSIKEIIERSRKIEKNLEKYAIRLSRWLWPWQETKLIMMVTCLAVLDFASTCIFLKLNANNRIYESGPLANWALLNGGLIGLLVVDIFAVITISAMAIGARYIFTKLGFEGYGRAAFVLMLIPYGIVAVIAIFNNIVITVL